MKINNRNGREWNGGQSSFPTQANDAQRGNANLHEIPEELVECVVRIATDEDLAVHPIMKDLVQ